MSMCEKCWSDAGYKAHSQMRGKAECYREILEERKDIPCTPEQQAGPDATICPKCKQKTRHQITNECMNCGLEE